MRRRTKRTSSKARLATGSPSFSLEDALPLAHGLEGSRDEQEHEPRELPEHGEARAEEDRDQGGGDGERGLERALREGVSQGEQAARG